MFALHLASLTVGGRGRGMGVCCICAASCAPVNLVELNGRVADGGRVALWELFAFCEHRRIQFLMS